jgi:hypothetical protein
MYLRGGRRRVCRRRITETHIPPKIAAQKSQRHGTSTPEKSGQGRGESARVTVAWFASSSPPRSGQEEDWIEGPPLSWPSGLYLGLYDQVFWGPHKFLISYYLVFIYIYIFVIFQKINTHRKYCQNYTTDAVWNDGWGNIAPNYHWKPSF